MATINMDNFGMAHGRLTSNPTYFDNKDGSKNVFVTVAVANNYKTGKERKSQFIRLKGFIPAKGKDNGVYDYMHEGDLVSISFEVRTNNYEDKAGNKIYSQDLAITGVQLKETKKNQEARAKNAEEVAEVPADEEAPF